MQIAIVLGLLVVAMVLFALEFISVDIITLMIISVMVFCGILTVEEALDGFSSEIIVMLAAIFVISGTLQQTGIMDAVGYFIYRVSGRRGNILLMTLMGAVGGTSAFINNTTTTAAYIPATVRLAKHAKIGAPKLLMPLAFASILGGTCTLIGTSTNVAVSGYIARAGLEPVGLLELSPVGIIALIVGIIYMVLIGQHLLPNGMVKRISEILPEYLCEVAVTPDSHLIGQEISKSDLAKLDFRILSVQRGKKKFHATNRFKIKDGDILLVQGRAEELLKVKETTGIEIKPELKFSEANFQNGELRIAEAFVTPKSFLIGQTVKTSDFQRRYGVTTLGISRQGHALHQKIGRIKLRAGDLLLIQGQAERMDYLRRNADFWMLENWMPKLFKKRKGFISLFLFGAALVIGSLGWFPLSITLLTAAILLILLRCVAIEDVYNFIDWRLLILIGGMTAFGLAMEKSGAAEFVANAIVSWLTPFGLTAVLAGFILLTILFTQPLSNAAAALVVLPIALKTAQTMGVNERTFAIAIMLAASISLIAPLEPSCILVYGPGEYRFKDFIKTGAPLTLILAVIVLFLIPVFWPF
jgi:di/tricarboxylate transporter